jgi:hypothetical protein
MDWTFRPHVADLEFDEERHLYRVRGEILPSVTGVLKEEGLAVYGNGQDSAWAMQVGTWAHKAIEWHERGTLDEANLPTGIRRFVSSWEKFKEASRFEPIVDLIELRLWQPEHAFGGTPDIPGRIDGRFVLVDLKTGSKRESDKVQVATYWGLLRDSIMELHSAAAFAEGRVVYLKDDGGVPGVASVDTMEMFRNECLFLSALAVNRWKKSNA